MTTLQRLYLILIQRVYACLQHQLVPACEPFMGVYYENSRAYVKIPQGSPTNPNESTEFPRGSPRILHGSTRIPENPRWSQVRRIIQRIPRGSQNGSTDYPRGSSMDPRGSSMDPRGFSMDSRGSHPRGSPEYPPRKNGIWYFQSGIWHFTTLSRMCFIADVFEA